ncbi:DOMON domain-containing protein [Dehalogenimonas etheniformans]|uniref:Uncharacterized protein n=1 Tax=Dehalogenimonas etheniformans TaxID=1536648 RepID=A0A2P5P7P9_9CHLR|nr:DOMON domain-containing protein [Dehalogenimonas etheniformans]PPD58333.1 hypothetical protein JP09_004275 [Dehalogenimonas etheniformans]QNT76906.1 hypothetical protein HX448_09575 [Dehalogenimonas etheniformans]
MKLRNSDRSLAKLVIIIPLAVIAISTMTACGGGGTPTTSNPPTSQPPTTTLPPSLNFPSGKYVNEVTYVDQFTLAYTVTDDGIISIGIKAKTGGWFAIAVGSPHGQSDIWIGYVTGGQVTLLDTHNASYSGAHPLDTGSGGTDDLTNITGSEGNGVTTIEFKRKLDTADKYDLPLVAGSNIVTWAIGPSDDTNQEHSVIGLATFEIRQLPSH